MTSETEKTSGGRKRTADQRKQRAAELRAKQLREEQRRKRMTLIGGGIGVLILIGAVAAAVLSQKGSDGSGSASGPQVIPAALTGATTTQKAVATRTNDSGIDGVVAYNTGGYPIAGPTEGAMEKEHVAGPVTYSVIPPVGGPHAVPGSWLNAGGYTKPIPSERAVHDLEHGAIWITYKPSLPAADVAALKALVLKQEPLPEGQATGIGSQTSRYMIMSPWADDSLPSPIVISSWGYQLKVTSATDERLQKFIDTFRSSKKYTPEYGSGVDGTPVVSGGRAAFGGTTVANPEGKAQTG